MKHCLIVAICLIQALLHGQQASAYDFSVEGASGSVLYYNVLSNGKCELTSGTEPYAGNVVIPEQAGYNGVSYTVAAIGGDAFLGCDNLESVTIPKSVTTIGSCAFMVCRGLSAIELPSTLETIGAYAFSGCNALKSVSIPASVMTIGDFAFYGCSSLATVVVSGAPETVGYNAFADTKWWANQPEGLVYYGDMLLGCRGSVDDVVDVKGSTRLIANGAFLGKTGIMMVNMPQSVLFIGSSAFNGCGGLASIALPKGVKRIGEYAFQNCHSLTSVTLPDALESIGWYAFAGCKALPSIALPESLAEIGAEAFKGCAGLTRITCPRVLPPDSYANAFTGVPKSDCELYVQETAFEAYSTTAPWSEFNIVVPSQIAATERCAAPVITVVDGKLNVVSDTPGSVCHYTISSSDMHSNEKVVGNSVNLTGQYNISAYAKAEGWLNSESTTAILVWVPGELIGGNILNMEYSKAIVLRMDGNRAVLCGTDSNESVRLFTIGGELLTTIKATGTETLIPYPLQRGQTYVVRYAKQGIKFNY